MKRIVSLVTAVTVMAAMMALGAGPAFADKGGGGHDSCGPGPERCIISGGGSDPGGGGSGGVGIYGTDVTRNGGGGGPGGGGGGRFDDNRAESEMTLNGGFGGPGGGAGGRCEFDYSSGTVIPTKDVGRGEGC